MEVSGSNSIRQLRGLLMFTPIYFFLSLIELTIKLGSTPAWFNGILERNQALLLAFQYTNNEQSRLLQFMVPEMFVRLFGVSVVHAYILQRWLFVWLAFCLFHFYLRKWFSQSLAFAGVCFLGAVMPLAFIHINSLQESAPLLMVMFLLGLWTIRAERWLLFTCVLLLGALDNETMLCLPALAFFVLYRGHRPSQLLPAIGTTLITALPAYVVTGIIRYLTRHQPHLGPVWQWPTNFSNTLHELTWPPIDYYHAMYLYPIFIFGILWVYAYLGYARKPDFIARSLLLVPLFIIPNYLTGISAEVREMIPLAFIIIPAAMFWMFKPDTEPAGNSP